jgi:cbb3-type cytochrome oxidase subunit 3
MLEFLIAVRPLLVVVMFASFLAMLYWVYTPLRRAQLEECGRIPLSDDEA